MWGLYVVLGELMWLGFVNVVIPWHGGITIDVSYYRKLKAICMN